MGFRMHMLILLNSGILFVIQGKVFKMRMMRCCGGWDGGQLDMLDCYAGKCKDEGWGPEPGLKHQHP